MSSFVSCPLLGCSPALPLACCCVGVAGLDEVCGFVEQSAKATIALDPTLRRRRIQMRIEQVDVRTAMTLIAHMARARLRFRDGRWRIDPIPPKKKKAGDD